MLIHVITISLKYCTIQYNTIQYSTVQYICTYGTYLVDSARKACSASPILTPATILSIHLHVLYGVTGLEVLKKYRFSGIEKVIITFNFDLS